VSKKHLRQQHQRTDRSALDAALAHARNGAHERAIPLFSEYLKKNPCPQNIESTVVSCFLSSFEAQLKAGDSLSARRVLDRLETYVPSVDLSEARGRCLSLVDDPEQVLLTYVRGGLDLERSSDNGRMILADALVLAEACPSDCPVGLARDRDILRGALQHLAAERYEEALVACRSIEAGRLFEVWVKFIKALVAFYQGDFRRARMGFERLPEGSRCRKIGARYSLMCVENPGFSELEQWGLLRSGFSEFAQRFYIEIKQRQYWRAYRRCRQFFPKFPEFSANISGLISGIFLTLDMWEDEGGTLFRKEICTTLMAPIEEKFYHAYLYFATIHSDVINDIVELDDVRGNLNDLISHLCIHMSFLGNCAPLLYEQTIEAYAHKEETDLPSFCGESRSDESKALNIDCALEYCKKLCALDEAQPRHFQRYHELLLEADKKSEANHLADEMIRRFPDDKASLRINAQECLSRKVYVKAIKLLEKACELDGLDAQLRILLYEARIGQAIKYFQEPSDIDKGRKLLDRTEKESTANDMEPFLDHQLQLINRIVLEDALGDPQVAQQRFELLMQSEVAMGHYLKLLLQSHRLGVSAYQKSRKDWLNELHRRMKISVSFVEQFEVLKTLCYWKKRFGEAVIPTDLKLKLGCSFFMGYVKRGSLAELQNLLELLVIGPLMVSIANKTSSMDDFKKLEKQLAQRVLELDPLNPYARFIQLSRKLLHLKDNIWNEKFFEDYKFIAEEARARHHGALVKMIDQLMMMGRAVSMIHEKRASDQDDLSINDDGSREDFAEGEAKPAEVDKMPKRWWEKKL
jgi:tetratricopeptide (TPR) repeat protein